MAENNEYVLNFFDAAFHFSVRKASLFLKGTTSTETPLTKPRSEIQNVKF